MAKVDKIFLPRSFVVLVAVLAAGLFVVVMVSASKKRREPHYAPLFNNMNGRPNGRERERQEQMAYTAAQQRYQGSYQHQYQQAYRNQLVSSYAMPLKTNDITYCIIDERLVDN